MSGIKALALDLDGVLTDGAFYWGVDGSESKRFSFRDVMGIARAMRRGLLFALITGEANPLVDRYASKMGIVHVWQGCSDKSAALRAFATAVDIPLSQIGFMGDDVNDIDAMQIAGWSAAPADAHPAARAAASWVTQRSGGNGSVREALDKLIPDL
jgi:3-deoxy-D-manno-octulosonate 8-phosphate phosphatase (KDO 8-P phosphatase)